MPKFFYPVLNALNDGTIIRGAVEVCLRILAILTIPIGAFALIGILKLSFQLPTEGTIGGLLFAAAFAVTLACVSQIYWYRADSIRDLGDSPFTVIPVVSVLFRAVGEVQATFCAAIGVGGCLFMWLAKMNPIGLIGGLAPFLPSSSMEASFLGGITFLIYFGLFAIANLLAFYFLAEAIVVAVDIARQIRSIGAVSSPDPAGNHLHVGGTNP